MIGSYKVTDAVTIQAGIADATTPLNGFGPVPNQVQSSDKTIAASVAFTAPDSFGFAKGDTLSLGTLLNIDGGGQDNFYAGLTVPTPMSALKVGASFDLVSDNNQTTANRHNDSGFVLGAYSSFQATDKLSFNLRGEYFDLAGGTTTYAPYGATTNGKGEEVTATLQYNLWANVISRAEFRWDHIDSGTAFSNTGGCADSFLLAANLIYTF